MDDYILNKDGDITLLKKTDDKFDRLITKNEDGSLNEEDAFIVSKETAGSETILTALEADEYMTIKNAPAYLSQGSTTDRDLAYSLFNFVASNSKAEWSMAHTNSSGLDNYSLGTFQRTEVSPSYARYNLSLDNMVSHIHSHPDPGVGDLESMGMDSNGKPFGGDWSHEIKRYYENGNQSPYYNAVYFPGSGRLYNVQAAKGPVYIRNIKNDYRRFFYGRL